MAFRSSWREHVALGAYLLKWLALVAPVAAVIGSASALFLWSLDWATRTRLELPWLLFLLPLAGAGISMLYARLGGASEGGTNLLMDAIHGASEGDTINDGAQKDSAIVVPRRMAPLILTATVVTHLFGGSAGREGTALQMGGAIAAAFGRWFQLNEADVRTLLMAGIAAGFGGVFGTPLAGAVFAMEVLTMGRIKYESLVPCLIAAVIADWACLAWGVHHVQFVIAGSTPAGHSANLDWLLAAKVALAAVAFGLVSVLFSELTHCVNHFFKKRIAAPVLRPVVGGVLLIAMVYLLGTREYLGLGVASPDPRAVTILSSFAPGGAHNWSWLWKILFTAVTLGSGFKGGEVTPLFFIGAALGSVLAGVLGAPVDLFAGLGLVAVFAGATNTPLACTLMGIELFGAEYSVYIAIACFLAYACSGHSGIYLSQRIGAPKSNFFPLPRNASLRTARDMKKNREK